MTNKECSHPQLTQPPPSPLQLSVPPLLQAAAPPPPPSLAPPPPPPAASACVFRKRDAKISQLREECENRIIAGSTGHDDPLPLGD